MGLLITSLLLIFVGGIVSGFMYSWNVALMIFLLPVFIFGTHLIDWFSPDND